jgi:hypothetical protein
VNSSPSIIEQYWAGVQQRLEAEVAVFSELVRHEGERGRENEAALGRILGSFVPQRYGVGSRLLIDSQDQYGQQTDLVVFDQADEPSALAQTTQLLFPIESVLASIEVKTTLRKEDIADCLEKQQSLLALKPARSYPDESIHPLFVVLAYSAGPSPQTIVKHFVDAKGAKPDLLCVLRPGLLLGTAPQITVKDSQHDLRAGLALVKGSDGNFVTGTPTGPEMMSDHQGRSYPIIKYDGVNRLADRARALLLFVEALVALLAEKQARRAPALSYYITDDMRALAPLT